MAGKEKKTPVKPTPSTPKMNYTKTELNKFNKEKLMELFLEAQDYTASLQEKIDSLTTKLDALTVRVDAQEKADSSPSSKQMENLERDSYAIQQYSRRECIEIAGIPTSIPNENVEAKCIEIINAIGVDVDGNDLQACHRLFSKDRVIVKFIHRKKALKCLYNKSKLKDIPGNQFGFQAKTKLYINESLCPPYRRLFGKCNQALLKNKKIKNLWTFNGNIKIRLLDDQVHTIFHENDLKSLNLS